MDRLYFFCFVILISLPALGAEIKVMYSQGENYKSTGGDQKVLLTKGVQVAKNERIITAENGLVILKIENHSILRIDEETDILVEQLPYFLNQTDVLERGAVYRLIRGTIMLKMLKKTEGESLSVKTADVVFGVRGTLFLADLSDDLTVSVKEGLVNIQNSSTQQEDFIGGDESMILETGSIFTERQNYDFQREIDWDIESRKRKKRFRKIRKKLRAEFKRKRRSWKLNKKRLMRLKQGWQKKRKQRKALMNKLKKRGASSAKRDQKKREMRQKLKKRLRRKN